jgi:TM2 domain-containing membrane protein YozV
MSQNLSAKVPVNKILYIVLAFFMGYLGIHKFIIGKVTVGIIYIVIGLFTFFVIVSILVLIDIIKVATLPADTSGNVMVKTSGFFEK